MSKIVVIPDTHSEPNTNNDRFVWLGKLIAETRPDYVVHLGDHFDLASASHYDRGKLIGEGQRVKEDLAIGGDTLELVRDQVPPSLRRRIEWVFVIGNHEDRLDEYSHDHPEWDGIIGTALLPLDGWTVVPYLEPIEIDGVWFSHFYPSGVMNRPIGGVNAARSALLKLGHSVVWGHSHEFHYSVLRSPLTGLAIHGLNAGCYFEHNHQFAGPANKLYTRGISVLRGVESGELDLEFISIRQMKARYGQEATVPQK